MHARAIALGVLAAAITLATAAKSRAMTPEEHPRVDYTAYALGRNEFRISPFQFQYGVLDEITLDTFVVPWFVFPWIDVPIPTAGVKLRDWFHGPLALSFRANIVYLNATALSNDLVTNQVTIARTSVFIFPLELNASLRFSKHFTQSLELSVVQAAATSHVDEGVSIHGNVLMNTWSLTSLSELWLTKVFALSFLGRIMLAESPVIADANARVPGADVGVRFGAAPPDDYRPRFSLVPGISVHVENFGLDVGVGYGHPWLPVVRVPYVGRPTVVPEFNAYFRF
jgi:hypothetical protein